MRFVFFVLELLFFSYLLFIVFTQIIEPLMSGTKLFPFLRSRSDEVVDIRTAIEAAKEETSIEELLAELTALKKKEEVKNNDADDDGA